MEGPNNRAILRRVCVAVGNWFVLFGKRRILAEFECWICRGLVSSGMAGAAPQLAWAPRDSRGNALNIGIAQPLRSRSAFALLVPLRPGRLY